MFFELGFGGKFHILQGLYTYHLLFHGYLILYQALLYEFKVKGFFFIY